MTCRASPRAPCHGLPLASSDADDGAEGGAEDGDGDGDQARAASARAVEIYTRLGAVMDTARLRTES
jgi:hypothetical protein